MKVAVTLSPRDYDVVLFELDGMLSRKARVHAAAWKRLFDGSLEQRANKVGTPFVHGVESNEPAIVVVRKLREQEIKTAVVSSSNNCAVVLGAACIAPLRDARVDGLDLTRLGLEDKRAPGCLIGGGAARRRGAFVFPRRRRLRVRQRHDPRPSIERRRHRRRHA